MHEYQAVILKLHCRRREDEEGITDVLNERARMGWTLHRTTSIRDGRLLLVFTRETE